MTLFLLPLLDYHESDDEYFDDEDDINVQMRHMDAGSDVMLDYPSDCFKESCYQKCPMCVVSIWFISYWA